MQRAISLGTTAIFLWLGLTAGAAAQAPVKPADLAAAQAKRPTADLAAAEEQESAATAVLAAEAAAFS